MCDVNISIFSRLNVKHLFFSPEAHVAISNIFNKAVSFLVFSLISKHLLPGEYANFVIIMAVILAVSELGNTGILQGVTRHLAVCRANSNSVDGVVFTALINGILIFLFIMVFFALGIEFGFLNDAVRDNSVLMSLYIVLSILMSIFNSTFNGLGRYSEYAFTLVISGSVLLLSTLFLFVFNDLSVSVLLGAYILSMSFSIFFQAYRLRDFIDLKYKSHITNNIWSFGKWYTVWAVFSILDNKFEVFLMSAISSPIQLAVYDVSTKYLLLVQVFISSAVTILNPELVAAKTDIELCVIKNKTKRIQRLLLLWCIMSIPIVYYFIDYYYGGRYDQSGFCYMIQSIGVVFLIYTFPLSAEIYRLGKPQFFMIAAITSALTKILFSLLLIPVWGSIGAAICFVLSSVAVYILTLLYVRVYLKGLSKKY